MDKYISREAIIEELEEEIAAGDEFDEKDVLINKGLKIALKDIKRQPAADVISRKEVLELIESFKVESTHELSKSDFDRNDTLRLLQDVIKGVTWEDVL